MELQSDYKRDMGGLTDTMTTGVVIDSKAAYTLHYHSLFAYPLTIQELYTWRLNQRIKSEGEINFKDGYFFLAGREADTVKRKFFQRVSRKKMRVAKRAAELLGKLPWVKLVGITGSLAMMNASPGDDIDLLVVTKRGKVWSTRLLCYLLLFLGGFKTRKFKKPVKNNALCLNMWLDENDLVWNERNVYTAHEFAQIRPLINKDETHEKLLWQNRWILDFWPNAVEIVEQEITKNASCTPDIFEKTAFFLQKQYMKHKVTREVVTPTRAIFHPRNLGKTVTEIFH